MALLFHQLGAVASAVPVASIASRALLRVSPLGAAASAVPAARVASHASFRTLALDSPDFPVLRTRRNAFVDKTGAIADLLMSGEGMRNQQRVLFVRPRAFGKTLTLSIAAEMLAAGALPDGVEPWQGFSRVDVDACFGGLAVHKRLRSDDPTICGLLTRAHFVIKLSLGDAPSGDALQGGIYDGIAGIAGAAFGDSLKAEVHRASSPGKALATLVHAVPDRVPVALLIDDYDAAIVQDVLDGNWSAAKCGIKALRSLVMATKSPVVGARIERCIVTGVARFAHTSIFTGPNTFVDLTSSPLLSRVLGLREEEIRASFPDELLRLAAGLGVDSVDAAIAQLAHWYDGYCFDGVSTSFSPFPVLQALKAGIIATEEMEAASRTNWLDLSAVSVLHQLAKDLQQSPSGSGGGDLLTNSSSMQSLDIANLDAQQVAVVPLLLQMGLLSVVPGRPDDCHPPNEYARQSIRRMLATATSSRAAEPLLTTALHSLDRGARH